MRTRVFATVIMATTLLVGCSNENSDSDKKEEIAIHNNKVEKVISNYEKTKEKGKVVEELLDKHFKDLTDINKKEYDKLLNNISQTKETIETVLEYNILRSQELMLERYHVETEKELTSKQMAEHQKNYKHKYSIKYLMDDETGVTEQMVLIDVDGMQIGYFTLNWIGDRLVSVEEFRGDTNV